MDVLLAFRHEQQGGLNWDWPQTGLANAMLGASVISTSQIPLVFSLRLPSSMDLIDGSFTTTTTSFM